MNDKVWSYSFDQEHYDGSFATREDAIAEARASGNESNHCWVGKLEYPDLGETAGSVVRHFVEYDFFERFDERLCDDGWFLEEAGDTDFRGGKEEMLEALDALESVVSAWAKERLVVRVGTIRTAEMVVFDDDEES